MSYALVPDKDGRAQHCTFTEGRLSACWPLKDALEFPHGNGTRRQGVKLPSLVSTETHKFTRNAVALISGNHGKYGVQLTLCPFCAGLLQPALAEDVTITVTELPDDEVAPAPSHSGERP